MKTWYEFKNVTDQAAELYLYGYVGEWPNDSMSFIQALKALPSGVKEISLRVNSPGGSVIDGFATYNALLRHPARVIAHVDGWAASMASIIIMAADEIHMPGNTWVMIHNPWAGVAGDAEELRKYADILEKMQAQAIDAYSRHTSADRAQIAAWMNAETWFTGAEFDQYGFSFIAEDEMAEVAAAFDPSSRKTAPDGALAIFNLKPKKETGMFLELIRKKMGNAQATEAEAVAFAETLKTPEVVLELTDAAYAEGEAKAKAEAATALATALSAKDAEIAAVKAANEAAAVAAQAAYDELAAKHERLMGGLKPPSGKAPERTAFAEFRAKVVAVMAEAKVDESEAGVKVRREFPALFDAMIAESNRK